MQATADSSTGSSRILDRGLERHHDRYLTLALNARHWRLGFCFMAIVAATLAAALGYIASNPPVKVVIATLDPEHRVRYAPAATATLAADSSLLQSVTKVTVHEWIVNARTITADPLAQQRLVESVWTFSAPDAQEFLKAYYETIKPTFTSGDRVTVEVESLQLRSDKYWEIEWQEKRWSPDGRAVSTERWEGRLQTQLAPPTSLQVAELNPAGIYITGLSWARRAL